MPSPLAEVVAACVEVAEGVVFERVFDVIGVPGAALDICFSTICIIKIFVIVPTTYGVGDGEVPLLPSFVALTPEPSVVAVVSTKLVAS